QAARREGAWGAWARGARVEAAAKVRQALEAADSPALRFLWWRLRRDALRWTALRNIPRAVARSPDGRHIAVGSGSGAIYLLDARTGGLVKVLRGHPEQILFLRYAFDGQLVSGDWRGQVRSWFPPRLLLERKLRYASGALIGAQLITATFGREVHVWRVPKTGRATLVKRLPESKNSYEIAVSPDGKLLAAAGIDKKARLWRLPEATPIAGALLHESAVRDVKWVSRERLLTTTVRGHVRVFAISRAPGAPETPLAPKLVLAFETGQAWPHAVVIARRQLVATSGRRGRIALWSLRDGKRVAWLDRRSNAPSAGLMASPDGTRLYGSDRDRGVRAFDIRAPIRGQRWRPHARMLTNAAFSADGKRIATTSYDKTVRIWSAARGEVQHVLELPAGARVVSFSPDGQRIIAGARDGRIRVWRIGESRVRSFGGHEQDVMALGVARDRSVFVSGGRDRKLLLWRFDGAGGVRATNLGKHDRRVFSLAISRDKRLIASGGVGGTVRLWPLPAASAKAAPTASRVVLRGGTAAYGLDFTPAGELAISLTSREVLLLDPRRAGATPRRLGRFAGRTYSLQLDPDGKRLALPGSDHVLRLMRLADGKTRALYGHRDEINVARFDDRGRVVVSVSDDSTVRLWDAQSGAPKWFGAGLLGSPPRLLSHHGWRTLSPHGAGETAEPGRAFAAAFDGARGAVRTFDQGSGAAGALCVVRRDG
ncbi:MAG: hypothetical protein KC503_19145, partial [Myxococcales bacterium]|nr:hypothetical protein [Myxococcales bacterium]